MVESEVKRVVKETEEWLAKQKLLQMSEVSLVLHSYDDIFSDFDPRPYENRSLSDDFLLEMKRAAKEKKYGIIELNFLIPAEQRKAEKEAKIKKRLRDHFKKHFDLVRKEISVVRKNGVELAVIGFALATIGALFIIPAEESPDAIVNAIYRVLLVIVEPAAWFTIWTGFERIFTTWKELEPDLEFYKKMAKAEINFTGY